MKEEIEKLSNEDLKNRIRNEGIGYAILSYYGRDIQCEDKEAERLWKAAYDKLTSLQNYLNEQVDDGEDIDGYNK